MQNGTMHSVCSIQSLNNGPPFPFTVVIVGNRFFLLFFSESSELLIISTNEIPCILTFYNGLPNSYQIISAKIKFYAFNLMWSCLKFKTSKKPMWISFLFFLFCLFCSFVTIWKLSISSIYFFFIYPYEINKISLFS